MKIRLLAVLIGTFLLTLLVNLRPPAEASNQLAMAKIAPLVIERAKDNQPAEFLVVFGEQADLSGADQLATKEEKAAQRHVAACDVVAVTHSYSGRDNVLAAGGAGNVCG